MLTAYNLYVRFGRDWDGRAYTYRNPVGVEGTAARPRFFVGGPGMGPATLRAEQIGPAIEAVRKQCSDIAQFEILPDGEYEAAANPPPEVAGGGSLGGCPGDVAARDSF